MTTPIGTLLSRYDTICGGRMRIDGMRVTVHQIVTCYQNALTAEEILQQYPHINLAQAFAALAHYHANREGMDKELEAETADFLRLSGDAESEQKEWHNSSEN